MSFFKKLFAVGSTVAMMASGFLPSAALAAAHGPGSVVKTSDGTVWFVTSDNMRRAFTSEGAFKSYGFLSFAQVVDANTDDNGLIAGSFIAPRDGSVFCASMTKGTDVAGECSLITGGMKAAFTSAAVFAGQGYSFARAFYGDSSFLSKTSNIDNAGAAHRQGALVNQSGTVYLVGTSTLLGIPSVEVFNSWGYSFADVVPANSADMSITKSGVMCARVPGQLNPSFTADACGDDGNPEPGSCDELDGGAGDITTSLLSTYAGEDVGEGEEDAPVLAFEVEADEDSDVEVTSVKVELQQTVTTNSEDITDYLDEVTVWLNGEMVGSADADDFTETNDRYSKSIALDCAIVRSGDTEEFSVAVTALDSLDSADIDDDAWDVELDQIRFVDGDGVTTTDTPAANDIDQAFDLDSFASANDVELQASLTDDADDINTAHVIEVDTTSDTDNVEILAFSLEANGDSDVNVTEIPVLISTVEATGNDPDDLITGVHLWLDGDEIASETLVTTDADDSNETVTFDDLDIDIGAEEMADFVVSVDLQDTTAALDNGDTVQARLNDTTDCDPVTGGTQTCMDLVEAEDETGEDLVAADLTGSANGDAHAVYSSGIMVEYVSSDATLVNNTTITDQGTYEIQFRVTAFGADAYIQKDTVQTTDQTVDGADNTNDNADDDGLRYDLDETAGTAVASGATVTATGDVTELTNTFRVDEDDEAVFTFKVTGTPSVDSSVRAILYGIEWGTSDIDNGTSLYIFDMGLNSDYKTEYLFLDFI